MEIALEWSSASVLVASSDRRVGDFLGSLLEWDGYAVSFAAQERPGVPRDPIQPSPSPGDPGARDLGRVSVYSRRSGPREAHRPRAGARSGPPPGRLPDAVGTRDGPPLPRAS